MLLRLYGRLSHASLHVAGARKEVIEAAGYQVVVHDLGARQAPPCVLLHGLGATGVSWMPVMRPARRSVRLILPELSALGGTRGPRPAIPIKDAATVLDAVLEQLGISRPATVAGMSLGAWMAVRLALDRPRRVAALILVDAAGWRDQDWDHVRDLVDLDSLEDVRRFYRALFVRPPWVLRCSRRSFLAAYRSPAVRSILAATEEADTYDEHDLARIVVPARLIWAAEDGLFPPAIGEAICRALPNARLEILENCGHGLHWERPRAFRAAFLRALEDSRIRT